MCVYNFFLWLDSPSRPGPPHCWGFEITLRLLWTSDQPVPDTST